MSPLENSLAQCIKEALLPEIKTLVHQAVKEALDTHPTIGGIVEEEYLTAEESAALIKAKLANFRKRLARGEIPRYGPPGKVYCKKSDLLAFMSQQSYRTQSQLETEAKEALSMQFSRKSKGASQQSTLRKAALKDDTSQKAA